MAVTLEQVNTFHADRGNSEWAALGSARSAAMLKAADYVEATYAPLIADAELAPRYVTAFATLALDLALNPQGGLANAKVKKEAKEGAGFKKEVEYFENPEFDPFPHVSALFAPLIVSRTAPAVRMGKVVRG